MNKFIFKKEKIIKFSTETNKQKTNRALKSWCTGTTWRDGMGREKGRRFGTGGHIYTHGRFMSTYGKNQHNIVISPIKINK